MTHVRWAWCFGDWAPSGRDHSPDCCEPFSSRCEASLRGQPTKGRATSLKVLKCLSCRLDSVGSAQLHFFLKPSNIWTFCSKKMSSISCVDFFPFFFPTRQWSAVKSWSSSVWVAVTTSLPIWWLRCIDSFRRNWFIGVKMVNCPSSPWPLGLLIIH